MSGYLANLAARALGVSDVARPRPSLFEPRRGGVEPLPAEPEALEARAEEEAAPPEKSPPELPLRREQADAPPPREREGPPAPEWERGPPPMSPPRPAPRRARRARERLHSEPEEPVASPAIVPGETATSVPAPEPPLSKDGGEGATEPSRPAPPATALLEPGRLPQRVLPPKQAPEPTVHVTIGRVDVRAVKADEPTERAKRPRPGPRMSLDDYLARSSR
jgi:hypothetical protein